MKGTPRLISELEPNLTGRAGRAWRMDLDEAAADGEPHSSLESWIVEATWAHPFWPHYGIALIHLRDVPGSAPCHLSLPGATHQIIVLALDPDKHHAVNRPYQPLMPLNFSGQFIAKNDEAAELRVRSTAQEIVDGELNPDTDALHQWVQRFGDSMLKAPYRGKPHPAAELHLPQHAGDTTVLVGTGAAAVAIASGMVAAGATIKTIDPGERH